MKNIAVVMGGYSAERVISFNSGKVVAKNLQSDEFSTHIVVIDRNDWKLVTDNKEYRINKKDFSTTINGINIFFDAKSYNIIGWQNIDIYQNLVITYLFNIKKNIIIKKNQFKLPTTANN